MKRIARHACSSICMQLNFLNHVGGTAWGEVISKLSQMQARENNLNNTLPGVLWSRSRYFRETSE